MNIKTLLFVSCLTCVVQNTFADDRESLIKALWFEARGEGIKGLMAVAQVIYNRVDSSRYPDTIYEVVHQPTRVWYKPWACQFSFNCDGISDKIKLKNTIDEKNYKLIEKIVDGFLSDRIRYDISATMYHRKELTPNYDYDKLSNPLIIERHIFWEEK